MIGACGHAEEWAEMEVRNLGIPIQNCSFYVAGFDTKTTDPWIRKETKDFSCLRCATRLYMAGLDKIWVPFVDRWDFSTSEEAIKKSVLYALGEKKV